MGILLYNYYLSPLENISNLEKVHIEAVAYMHEFPVRSLKEKHCWERPFILLEREGS